MWQNFDKYAGLYDSWFIKNPNVLLSEVRLVAATLEGSCRILSVGCGSGLFESILAKDFRIEIHYGIEPADGMAEIARLRGMEVQAATAETADYTFGGAQSFDTILFNGSPGYIDDLTGVLRRVYEALPEGGKVVLIDIPKESSYGLLYNLAKALGTWEHPLLEGCYPPNPYPIELVSAANWRTTAEKAAALEEAGFKNFTYLQTLTTHPLDSDLRDEMPAEGFDKGDYVAITAVK